ncbi:HAD family hydrolase [Actinomadura barringtoniae]|uniref:HAD family hydrolase n=1 Tax=Actinomadura barringtoniae TaxID=1427535 RepID=A0A939T139_9ACTN|nr:HAD family hydrolase [Actinomadura barringtoniae]MBO2446706.1 HAD family hydrolase [Actinomadura barringtoniae]
MAVDAVIFDWGGTLTPWHDIRLDEMWRRICSAHLDPGEAQAAAEALLAAEDELWRRGRDEHRSATLAEVYATAGIEATEAILATQYETWTPHTFIDPDAIPLITGLRERGIKVGVLSNTMWTRDWHERIFDRDGVLGLLDGAVYSSEIPWTKPHANAFKAAMEAVGAEDPGSCVFVGDRPYDDIHGAKSTGMRGVLIPNSTVPAWDDVTPDATIGGLAELLPHVDRWSV